MDVMKAMDNIAPLLNLSTLDASILERVLLGDNSETAAAYCGVSVNTCNRALKRITARAADHLKSRMGGSENT